MPDRSDQNRLKRENPFQLHYFPEIPLGKSTAASSRRPAARCFQPSGGASGREPAKKDATGGTEAENADSSAVSAADIEKQAYNRGFSKGEKAGLAAAAVKLDATLAVLNRAIEEARRLKDTLYAHAEKEIVELSLGIAEKVIARQVRVDGEVIRDVVRSALAKVNDCESITVWMNPADYRFLDGFKDRLSAGVAGERIAFKQDDGIQPGGCLVETDCGDIDARLESRIQVVAEALRAKLEQ